MTAAAGDFKFIGTRRGGRAAELVVGTVFINILAVALPLFSLQIFDRVLPNRAQDTLIVLVIGVIAAVGLEIVLRLERAKNIAETGAAFERNLSLAAVDRILNSDISESTSYPASKQLQRLQSIRVFRDFHSGYAIAVLIDFSFVFIYLALIFHIGGMIVLAPLIIVALIVASGLAGSLSLRKTIDARRTADEARYDFLVSTLQSISALKCFSLEKLFERRYEPLEYATSIANFRVSQASANILNASMVLGNLMTAAVVTAGVAIATFGTFTIGSIIACILLSGRLISPLQKATILWMKYQEYDAGREQFLSLIENHALGRDAPAGLKPAGDKCLLAFRKLSLSRRRAGPPLLSEASIEFDAGDIVIVGAETAQKASLVLKMIAGLAAPSEGEIEIDGKPLSAIPLIERSGYVAYLSPAVELFNGTILDNLTSFGLCNRESALRIAQILGIDQEAARMPNGWNTTISGKYSDETPTGLKQRIAIARAFAPRPRVILFDEAEELLDNRSYDLVITTLAALSSQSVIFLNTTDQNLVKFCNRELKIANDGLAAIGSANDYAFGRLAAI